MGFSQNLRFLINLIFLSIYLVINYLHTVILTPRSSKSDKNSSLYDLKKEIEIEFLRFLARDLSPWESLGGGKGVDFRKFV